MEYSLVCTSTSSPDSDLYASGPPSLSVVGNAYIQINSREQETQWFSGDFLSSLSSQTEIEIHCEGKIFFWEYLDHYHSSGITNLRLKLITVKKSEKELSLDDVFLPTQLLDVSEPYVIKEDGWDLIWFSFDGGHMVFYFKKPEEVL